MLLDQSWFKSLDVLTCADEFLYLVWYIIKCFYNYFLRVVQEKIMEPSMACGISSADRGMESLCATISSSGTENDAVRGKATHLTGEAWVTSATQRRTCHNRPLTSHRRQGETTPSWNPQRRVAQRRNEDCLLDIYCFMIQGQGVYLFTLI